MSNISTMIFDLGGVVLTKDWFPRNTDFMSSLSTYYNTSPVKLNEGWNIAWGKFYPGLITEDEFWHLLLTTSGTTVTNPEHAKTVYGDFAKENERMLDLLQKLKNNYRLAALTTISKEWLDFKRKKFDLDKYFETIVSSGYTGYAKPDPEIYDILIKKLNVEPKICLFVDDDEYKLPPAQKLGMKTILFTSQEQLEQELKNLNVNM